ncbi:MAG: helix-turn-helix transcriptional regulator [Pirellulaceae bacterium]|nr:helix-turn-helix transcriptional regulator [Pirellulaceae bacterium]
MAKTRRTGIECQRVELGGIRYVIVREAVFDGLCQQAGVEQVQDSSSEAAGADFAADPTSLATKLIRRRQAAGLSQAELARRAAIRPETLNRIERGRTTPDFATVRKLVLAMDAAELEGTDL